MTDLPTGPQNEQPDEVSFSAPAPAPANGAPSRTHRTARALTWVAVGAVGATVLTGVAFASTRTENSPSAPPSAEAPPAPAPSGAPSGMPGRPGGGRGPGGPGGHGGFAGLRELGDVLHGEFVVKQDDGSTKTMLGQRGAVTAASGTSLTVKSSDGFTATWTLSDSTTVRGFRLPSGSTDPSKATRITKASDLKVGDNVFVVGTRTSDTAGDATTVGVTPTDAALKALKDKVGESRGWRGGRGNGEAPKPVPSATASTTA